MFAGPGPGYGTWPSSEIGWEGAFRAPNGTNVYCIEPGQSNPTGVSSDLGIQGSVISRSPFGNRTLTANDLAKINRIVTTWGQTSSNREAAAVSFAVKLVANADAMYKSHGWNGSHDIHGFVNWVLNRTVGATEARAVSDRALSIFNTVAGTVAGPATGTGVLDFAVDPTNNYKGTVTIKGAPAGATGTITLTNGVFESTGTASLAGAKGDVAYPVRGLAPAGGGDYKISGTAKFDSGWEGNVRVWDTPQQQRTAGPGKPSSWSAAGEDPMGRTTTFRPKVVSAAPRFVTPGGTLTDGAKLSIVANAEGVVNEWFRNSAGEYAESVWTVKAYKVNQAPGEAIAEVPKDAELYDTVQVSSGKNGPTKDLLATFNKKAPADGGAFVFVWEFDGTKQPGNLNLLYGDYKWSDLFGLLEETSFSVGATSTAQFVARPGEVTGDTAHVKGVMPKEGLELVFEKYLVPMKMGDGGKWVVNGPAGFDPFAENADWRWAEKKENLVGSDSQTITKAGDYKSKPLPSSEEGGLELWVHTLRTIPAKGGTPTVVARSMIGESSERTILLHVSTQAQHDGTTPTVKPGTPIWDVAKVWGWIPKDTTVTYEAFRVKEDDAWVCDDSTRIWTSGPTPVEAGFWDKGKPQLVESEKFTPEALSYANKVTFVETTTNPDGTLSVGECGDASETVHYAAPKTPEGNLATTGGGLNMPLTLAGGGLFLAGAGLAATQILKRRKAAAAEQGLTSNED